MQTSEACAANGLATVIGAVLWANSNSHRYKKCRFQTSKICLINGCVYLADLMGNWAFIKGRIGSSFTAGDAPVG